MDLKQLSYFVRVAELSSFSRASIALDIAQPALSRQVRLLEVELRAHLLHRNGRGVTVTEAGKVLLEHSRGVLHQVERLREELSRVRGSMAGSVAVGLPPTISKVLTVPISREFRHLVPDGTLAITEGLSSTMAQALSAGRLDLALLYNASPSPELTLTPLLEEELWLVQRRQDAPANKVAQLKELAALELIIPSRPNAIRMQVELELINIGVRPRIALEIDGVAAILDLVADGAGCAILSRHAVLTAAHPDVYALRRIIEPRLASKLFIATHAHRPATETQRVMANILQKLALQALIVVTDDD
jgi:LysR family nitrogen assimilation transcriptional regulator